MELLYEKQKIIYETKKRHFCKIKCRFYMQKKI